MTMESNLNILDGYLLVPVLVLEPEDWYIQAVVENFPMGNSLVNNLFTFENVTYDVVYSPESIITDMVPWTPPVGTHVAQSDNSHSVPQTLLCTEQNMFVEEQKVAVNIPNANHAINNIVAQNDELEMAAKNSGRVGRKLHLYEKNPALELNPNERKRIIRAKRMKKFHENRKKLAKINTTDLEDSLRLLSRIENIYLDMLNGRPINVDDHATALQNLESKCTRMF